MADREFHRGNARGRLVTAFANGFLRRVAAWALAGAACVNLVSCGSGAVTDNTGSGAAPSPIAITPSTATLFSDLPTTFVLSGGNGSYVVTSNNQAVIPLGATPSGSQLIVVPNSVAADTPVILTVTDTANNTATNATVTVKPRTINNVVTVTPSASQSAACGTAVCSGGDAEVAVTLSQNGTPLANRTVRFDIVSGDIRLITSAPGLPEALGTSTTTNTDSTGTARVRIRVLADAQSQTALLQVTDLSSGFTQRASVTIAPASNAPLNAQPATITFKGFSAGTCASGISADVIVFGGRPPYQISQPGSFTVSPIVVTQSGGRFTVTATGQCTAGSQIAVVDNNGASVTVTASNTLSDLPVPAAPVTPNFDASPDNVSLGSCNDTATVSLIGGTGNYVAASGNAAVSATVSGSTGSIRRNDGAAPGTNTVVVSFSDGKTTDSVTVTLNGSAAGACPTPPAPTALTATPSSITLSDCTTSQGFQISGGNGFYNAIQNGNSFTYFNTFGSNLFFVRRVAGGPPSPATQFLTVTDGTLQTTVPINFTGAAAGTCP